MGLLEIRGLSKNFGGIWAVSHLDFEVNSGEILGLIGPNGAGKTTVFNLITGVFPCTRGKVIFKGEDVTGLKPFTMARKGVVRTFQLTALFESKTVLENMLISLHLRARSGFWAAIFDSKATKASEAEMLRRSLELLDFLGLSHVKEHVSSSLPHGYQRLLGIAMALAASPQLLLLDEPVTGMNPEETLHAMDLIKTIRDRGTSILLVEHDMRAVMGLCDRIVVLNFGKKIAEGSVDEIGQNEEVIAAYLGVRRNVAEH